MMKLIDADKLKAHYAWWADGSAGAVSVEYKKIFDDIVDAQPEVKVPKARKKEIRSDEE